jgi:hypothetical protein
MLLLLIEVRSIACCRLHGSCKRTNLIWRLADRTPPSL